MHSSPFTQRMNQSRKMLVLCTSRSMTVVAATRVAMVSHRHQELADRQRERNKKRAGRQALTVAQRVVASQEASEKRMLGKDTDKLLPATLLGLLSDKIRLGDWNAALRLFELVRKQQWYTPLVGNYIRMLDMLGRCKRPGEAADVYSAMLGDGIRPSREALTALMSAYTRSRMLDGAVAVLKAMESEPGCSPDCVSYTLLVKACCQVGDRVRAHRILEIMTAQGTPPNTVTYNTLLDAHGRARDLDSVRALLEAMLAPNSATNSGPDCWTLNAAVRSFGYAGRIDEMEAWFERITTSAQLQPDAVTLHSLMSAYGRAEETLDKMKRCLRYMYKYNYPLETVTYNILLAGYGRTGRPLQMESTFRRMKASGVKPNAFTYSTLLSCYTKLGVLNKTRLGKLLRLLEGSRDVKWDTALYNAILEAFRRLPDLGMLEEYFNRMKAVKDGFGSPDSITYSIVISAYDEHKMPHRAEVMRIELHKFLQQQGPYAPPPFPTSRWNGKI